MKKESADRRKKERKGSEKERRIRWRKEVRTEREDASEGDREYRQTMKKRRQSK